MELAEQEKFFASLEKNAEAWVFRRIRNTSLEDLPENTCLERALKKLYLSGGYIHAFAGSAL